MNITLIKASPHYKKQITDFRNECAESGERVIPTAISKFDYHDFDGYCEFLEARSNRVAEDRVPETIYFTLDLDRDIVVGSVDVRHYLTNS